MFPIITSTVDTDILDKLVSVQPMAVPSSEVIHWVSEAELAVQRRQSEEWLAGVKRALAPGEILKRYHYGDFLSERGGFYIINESEPTRVLRYLPTYMS